MWQANFQTTTDVSAEKLYQAMTDFNAWNKWDHGIERTQLIGDAKAGGVFMLKPKGGPEVKITIEKMWPFEVIDVAHLPLAKMRTVHKYVRVGDTTHIHMELQIWGLLGFVWRKIIGENQIKDAPVQTQALINYARAA
ncbi:MAG: polyketide cyclase [Moraxellaceae bacterium]|nr:MAG: polyketide cyclase [Moraxellaceae bacterium]